MEQMPHHREGIQNELDKAYEEGHEDNKVIDDANVRAEGETHISDNEMQSQLSVEEKVRVSEGEKTQERFKLISVELPKNFVGEPFSEATKYVRATYGDAALVRLPKDLNKLPKEFMDGKLYHFFGSAIFDKDRGREYVPYAWKGTRGDGLPAGSYDWIENNPGSPFGVDEREPSAHWVRHARVVLKEK